MIDTCADDEDCTRRAQPRRKSAGAQTTAHKARSRKHTNVRERIEVFFLSCCRVFFSLIDGVFSLTHFVFFHYYFSNGFIRMRLKKRKSSDAAHTDDCDRRTILRSSRAWTSRWLTGEDAESVDRLRIVSWGLTTQQQNNNFPLRQPATASSCTGAGAARDRCASVASISIFAQPPFGRIAARSGGDERVVLVRSDVPTLVAPCIASSNKIICLMFKLG